MLKHFLHLKLHQQIYWQTSSGSIVEERNGVWLVDGEMTGVWLVDGKTTGVWLVDGQTTGVWLVDGQTTGVWLVDGQTTGVWLVDGQTTGVWPVEGQTTGVWSIDGETTGVWRTGVLTVVGAIGWWRGKKGEPEENERGRHSSYFNVVNVIYCWNTVFDDTRQWLSFPEIEHHWFTVGM